MLFIYHVHFMYLILNFKIYQILYYITYKVRKHLKKLDFHYYFYVIVFHNICFIVYHYTNYCFNTFQSLILESVQSK